MIKLSKSVVGIEEVKAVEEVILKSGYLGMGEYVQKFEKKIADFLNTKFSNVVCVNSGTAALHLAVQSIITKDKNEVLVPSITYLSSFQAITAAGGVPIACDVDYDSMIIDLSDAKKRTSAKTAAIMPVWYASSTLNHDKIYQFSKEYNLRVIEDAAHAFGCSFDNKKIGSFGDIVCFSFDGIKNITSGEGGAIISSDSKVIDYCKDARLLGVKKDTENRFLGKRSWEFDVEIQGYRFHMSNIFAAIGMVQIDKFESTFASKRKTLFKTYRNELKDIPYIKLQSINDRSDIIPHIFPIKVLKGKRNELKNLLEKNNIQTGIHYKPNHILSKYKTNYNLLVSEKLYKEILTLPLHPDLEIKNVKKIIDLIKSVKI